MWGSQCTSISKKDIISIDEESANCQREIRIGALLTLLDKTTN